MEIKFKHSDEQNEKVWLTWTNLSYSVAFDA